MKLLIASLAAAALLTMAIPQRASTAEAGLHSQDVSSAKKKKSNRSSVYVNRPGAYGPARGAYGLRNDPSFDPYGRPWRPNFYAPCYEDLGYGRFRDCSDF